MSAVGQLRDEKGQVQHKKKRFHTVLKIDFSYCHPDLILTVFLSVCPYLSLALSLKPTGLEKARPLPKSNTHYWILSNITQEEITG